MGVEDYFMEQEKRIFTQNWCKRFDKQDCVLVESGRKAIESALLLLESKYVALPSYTCERVLKAVLDAGCKPYIVDCWFDLQINLDSLSKFKGDTVIVPHMFGIKAKVKEVKDMGYNVIEDCSQCLGLYGLGEHSDAVVVSTGPSKWLSAGGGGILLYDDCTSIEYFDNISILKKINSLERSIVHKLKVRRNFSDELINAGIELIGKEMPNAWMRGMYMTDTQKRIPYTPIHELYGGFDCPIVDEFKNKLDWISIFA